MINEKEIIDKCLNGQRYYFKIIFDEFKDFAYYFIYSYTKNKEETMDLLQDAFFKLYKSLPFFNTQKKLFPYFFQILKNQRIDFYRKYKYLMVEYDDNQSSQNSNSFEYIDIFKFLNDSEKQLIILKYYQGYSYKEIANLLDITTGQVRSKLYNIKKKLYSIYKKDQKETDNEQLK